jgi:hypothetical protein
MRRAAVALGLLPVLAPDVAAACAACVSSAYGDRTFNWAYGALLIAPFLVAVIVGVMLAWSSGYRIRWRRRSSPARLTGHTPVHEETS